MHVLSTHNHDHEFLVVLREHNIKHRCVIMIFNIPIYYKQLIFAHTNLRKTNAFAFNKMTSRSLAMSSQGQKNI